MNSLTTQRTHLIKSIAHEMGFSFCGISKAEFLKNEAPKLEEWLRRGYQGKMDYLENHFDKRLDPTLLVPGAKSMVSLVYNYFPKKESAPPSGSTSDKLKIARYAYGEDYHFVVKDKLKELLDRLRESIGEINGRVFVDSAPVMERAWAAKSGGGKHCGSNGHRYQKRFHAGVFCYCFLHCGRLHGQLFNGLFF